jgi:hypothetical protein
MRLRNCELLYSDFFDHFRRKGFAPQPPPTKLMVAIFDTQAGFEAYLGRKMSPFITGIYHPATNRFVTYDYGQNENFLAEKLKAEREGARIETHMDRKRYFETLYRQAREFRTGANIGTVMHETAHQLSFNCGLLNREGDKPLWLAEGLACYCEPTQDGTWLGIGEPNHERIAKLAEALRGKTRLFNLQYLLTNDAWATVKDEDQRMLVGYAQCWAHFRMLMEEQPKAMRAYLELIHPRRTPEHRLTDFQQVFGADLNRMEQRHTRYLKDLVQRYARPERTSAP